MISSFKINAVNEMATMFKNSFSNKTRGMIDCGAWKEKTRQVALSAITSGSTLVDAGHEPDEECLVKVK
jgi:hypothetical protein